MATKRLTAKQKAEPRVKRATKGKRALAAAASGKITYAVGAPSIPYDEDVGDLICELVATHPVSQDIICARYPEIPSEEVIRKWRFRHPEFAAKYWEAKKQQAMLHEEDCEKIVKNGKKDFYIDGKGNDAPNSVAVARDALILKHMHWHTSRLLPKIFGDKVIEDMRDKIVEQDATIERLNKMLELQKKHNKDY